MDHGKAKKIARVLAVILVAALVITSFSFVLFLPGMAGSERYTVYAAGAVEADAGLKQQVLTLEQLIKEIKANYKDDITYQDLMDGAFAGVFEALGDPFSVYYSTQEEGDEFVESVSGKYSGIGVSIESYNGRCRVVAPISGGPAEKAGIRTGDIVTQIDGMDISGKTLSEASAMMKGAAGTKVTLTMERSGQNLSFTITREKISNATVLGKMLDNEIGYIQITQFGEDTAKEFRAEKLKLLNQGADSLILDVRGNPGGHMSAATDIAGQLMPAGPILHYAQQGKVIETITARGSSDKKVPMVTLINEGSASATEALAGALQDSGTATLVGTTTYGKGVAQQVADLPNGASFKLSMFYFLTPKEHFIDHAGIAPDYAVYNGLGLTEEEIETIYESLAPMTEKVKYTAGQTGLNVYAAQQRLELLAFDVDVTGTMDDKTVKALKQFQKEHGFSPYGGLDFTTMTALEKALASSISGSYDDKQLAKAIQLLSK